MDGTADAAREPGRSRWFALALLASAQFVVVLDMTVVNVALPTIQADLAVPAESLQWVINAYVLTFGGFLLLGGRIADIHGRRRAFLAGFALFAVASLADGMAQDPTQLIVARAVQGIGGAILAPAALASVATLFTGAARNRAMGIWGAVAGSGGAAGLLLGGVLTDTVGWRWAFWVNVPIAVLVIALAPRLIPESRAEGTVRGLDVPGALAVTGGVSMLVYGLVQTESLGWTAPWTLGALAVAVLLLGAFVLIERRSAAPLVEFRIFRLRTATVANLAMLIFGAGIFTMMYFLVLYLQQVLGYGPLQAGMACLPIAGSGILAAQLVSAAIARYGIKTVLVGGLMIAAAGLIWFGAAPADGSYLQHVLGPSVVVALGAFTASVAITIGAVTDVPEGDTGLAGGLINVSQQIGSALGLAITATLAAAHTERLVADAVPLTEALADGFRLGFQVGAGFAAVAAALVAVLMPAHRPTAAPDADGAPRPDQLEST